MKAFANESREHTLQPESAHDEQLRALSEHSEALHELLETEENNDRGPWEYFTDGWTIESEILSKLIGWWTLRSVAVIQTGHLSLAPCHTASGDLLAVVLGLSHTVVLHPQTDGTYEFVGLAFTYGLEAGEALLGKLPPTWRFAQQYYRNLSWNSVFVTVDTGESSIMDPRVAWHELEVEKTSPLAEICMTNEGAWRWVAPTADADRIGTGHQDAIGGSKAEEDDSWYTKHYKWPDEEYLLRHGARIETIQLV